MPRTRSASNRRTLAVGEAHPIHYDHLGSLTSDTQTLAGLTPQLQYQSQYNALGSRAQLAATIGGGVALSERNIFWVARASWPVRS